MARQVSQSDIFQAVIDGITKAHEKYEEMSGGYWLGYAPEYFIAGAIAESIGEMEKVYVTLEHGVAELRCEAGIKCRGPMPKKMRDNGRADILVWWASEHPRAVIEVKHHVYSLAKLQKDIERLDNLLSKNGFSGKLQFGALAFYTEADALSKGAELLRKRYDGFYEKIKKKYDGKYRTSKFITDLSKFSDSDDAWAGICFGFHPYKLKSDKKYHCSKIEKMNLY